MRAAAMPPMVLLPLIDCACGTGTSSAAGSAPVRLTARAVDGRVHVTIHDAAARVAPERNDAWRAIEQRLRVLYGEAAGLSLDWREGSGTRAMVAIPHEHGDRDHR
jgi:LytS/YehU family sensor histidine kinase